MSQSDEPRQTEQPESAEPPQEPGSGASCAAAGLSPEELAEAKQYGRLGLYCSLADREAIRRSLKEMEVL